MLRIVLFHIFFIWLGLLAVATIAALVYGVVLWLRWLWFYPF